MRLSKHLIPKSVMINARPDGKGDLLRQMAAAVALNPAVARAGLTVDRIIEAINARESQGSTGIGNGFAFPHARMAELDTIAIALGLLEEEMDYGSIDDKPVKVVCLVLVPEKNPTLALKVMSQVARLFNNPVEAEKIRTARDSEAIIECINGTDMMLDVSITAQDIMRPPMVHITPDMPLRKLTRLMSTHRLNAVAVVDDQDCIVGEISCARLFQLGVPEFFTKLKSVGFICEFDPFEKYFFEEAHSVARDVMTTDFCAMPSSSTLLEIVFALTVQHHPCVYVVSSKGKLVGVVDQSAVLDQVINI